ncbi:MAG: CRISPR-associated endonuclease Cas1 [Dehalococcoidales bacterium]|nr:CRISPR-associated endonuclease Cas1 [Dehalococcoidales bacterium]
MKHLVVNDYGTFLGIRDGMLAVRDKDKSEKLFPLNRLKSVSIAKRGISLSSDLVEHFSERGIKLFFLGFKGTCQAALIGSVRHGVVQTRMAQYRYTVSDTLPLAAKIIVAKIKNQRSVLSYFARHHKHDILEKAKDDLKEQAKRAKESKNMEELLGHEGVSARYYFNALKAAELFSSSFNGRIGRGSHEINNSMLNFGYAILSSYILAAIENAGLEPYLGVIHTQRPGKMSLVLDIMEEYRAWVVDRAVIKLRSQYHDLESLTPIIKQKLITEIHKTCEKKYPYHQGKLSLEHIIQRQVYRLSGCFAQQKTYRPYLFKW